MFSVLKFVCERDFDKEHRNNLNHEKEQTQGITEQKIKGNKKLLFTVFYAMHFAVLCFFCVVLFTINSFSQSGYEDREINNVTIAFEGLEKDVTASDNFQFIAKNALGETYSAVRVRDAIDALYRTGDIVSASVLAEANGNNAVNLQFVIKRKTRAEEVVLNVGNFTGDEVTEQQLRLRLDILDPGTPITEQTLQRNATQILTYLRDRGYYNAKVDFSQKSLGSETEVAVTFTVTPGEQAKIEKFNINIDQFNAADVRKKIELKPGELYSREKLNEDITEIRAALRKKKYLAPEIGEPRVIYDSEKNTITIDVEGGVGAEVEVKVEAGDEKVSDDKLTELAPVKREGTLDYATIVEGERRLRNYFQQQGYFFAEVKAVCSVRPEFLPEEASETQNETEVICGALSGATLKDRIVDITYRADLNRRLRLAEIRLEGVEEISLDKDIVEALTTPNVKGEISLDKNALDASDAPNIKDEDKVVKKIVEVSADDVSGVLETAEANPLLELIPFLNLGRGFTSREALQDDIGTITTLMNELGYRRAVVRANQGVSLNGEDLIITFVVEPGIPTLISDVEITGNEAFSDAELKNKLPDLLGKNFSRARIRNGTRDISKFYAQEGFYDAKVNYSEISLPELETDKAAFVKVNYNVENEGQKVFINRILINGNDATKREAILNAINIKEGEVLRANDVFKSEQNLYTTDVFRIVEIKPEPAGEKADGSGRLSDIIIDLEEQPARLITYGGGYSTDIGANGFFDIRHFNLFGKLWQGGARIRASQLQQLVQIDYVNPRFLRDKGENNFAPLTITAQYQRDSTVTRFFRSTFDQGTNGIVQRLDEDGNPIDQFGNSTSDPTINRLTFSAETSRTISTKKRSFLFVRYKFEDVRLRNFESLLVRDLLRPDQKIRTSGVSANFVLDTRENCNIKFSLLEVIQKGEVGEPCRYNVSDPTGGSYLTAEYNFSAPFLGANIGFHKFQATYNRYYTISQLKNTTLAARGIIGLASVFSRDNGFTSQQFPSLEGLLPISERFFAGGSNTLRGFEFEGAGPRVTIVPQGQFRNRDGDPVFLDPFTIPFGGNALAIVNLEARIPFTDLFSVVPFYDGGNVFLRAGDIFNPPDVDETDVFRRNLRAVWSHTVGLGFRLNTPFGKVGIDYGYLLNPPQFLIPQQNGTNAIFQPHQGQIHFRFSQSF